MGKEWVLVCMKDGQVYLVNSTSVSVKTKQKPDEYIDLLTNDPSEIRNTDNAADSDSDSENKEYVFEGNEKSLGKNNKAPNTSKDKKENLTQENSKRIAEKLKTQNPAKKVST